VAARKSETARSAVHETVTLSRTLPARPDVVFEAWRSVEAREIWSVPAPGVAIKFEQAEFREGGVDISRCGAIGDMKYLATVRYADIVEDQRLVMVEDVSVDGTRLSVALVTLIFTPVGKQTKMDFTAQVIALDGSDMVQGYFDGWHGAFANLEDYLKRGEAA
jgi:uncharacterized protein YndB with AHSA1/START domain